MRITENKIEYRQLMFAVACFLQCVSVHISILINNAGQASWLIVILSGLMGIVGCLLMAGLCGVYGRRNLYEMLKSGLGKYIGTVVAIAYVCFFFWKFCDTLFEFTSFIKSTVLLKTPSWIIDVLIIVVCVSAARKGAAVFSSMSFGIAVIVLSFIVLSGILLIPNSDIQNFLPVFSNDFKSYMNSFFVSSAEPFGEIVAFLMIIPFLKKEEKNKKLVKALTWGVVIGTLTILLEVMRDVSALGVFSRFFTYPSFESIRLIDVGEVFSRVEIIYVILYTFLTFFKGTVLLFALSEMVKGVTKTKRFSFIPVISLMAFLTTTLGNDRVFNGIYMDFKMNMIINWIFAYIIPAILLAVGFIGVTIKLYKGRASKESLSVS